jgi:phosphoglycerate dehydrogenase-like enzyme
MRILALNCADDRPIWSMPEGVVTSITESLGPSWEVRVVESVVNSRGDGGSVSAEASRAVEGAEIYIGAGVPREILLAAGAGLRWAHTTTAGVSSFLYREMIESSTILTNSAGIHAEPMAESVVALMLYFARGFDYALAAQQRGEWDQDAFIRGDSTVREIAAATVAILGMGGIGRAVARRALALGMRVVGVTSRSTEADLRSALRACDYLVVAVPDTPRTRGLLGARAIEQINPTAVLINVSRGSVVDEDALHNALSTGRLRGAGLDVFRAEPLPPDSPLWSLPNVLITPHVSAVTRRFWERQLELILDNITRYLAGQSLRNVVDKGRGY